MDRSPPRDALPPAQFVAPTPTPAAPPPPRLRAYLPLVLCNLAAGLTAAVVWSATAGAVDPPRPATTSRPGAAEARRTPRRPPRREAPARPPTGGAERARGAARVHPDGEARAEAADEERPRARPAPPADGRGGRTAPAEAGAAGAPPSVSRIDETDNLFGPEAAEPLTVQVILDRVSAQVSVVEPCLQQGVVEGLLEYDVPERLVLDFVIAPSGRLDEPRVVGPDDVKGTTLAACMEAAMRGWRFPPSKRGAPVRNFPFGPFTIHAPGPR